MFIDIAFNGTSEEYKDNLDDIMKRAKMSSVMPIIVGLDVESSRKAVSIAKKYKTGCYFGIHPLYPGIGRDGEWSREHVKDELCREIDTSGDKEYIVGIGECGLDYYRAGNTLEQIEVFRAHLDIHSRFDLPYFIHCRSAFEDVSKMIEGIGGVVHSFDGSLGEMNKFIEMGFYIGINGCSLRTEEGIEVVRMVPLDRLLFETDSPYCLIRKSYAGSRYTDIIRSRYNEPSYIYLVAKAVANIKRIDIDILEDIVYRNTLMAFPKIAPHVENWKRVASGSD